MLHSSTANANGHYHVSAEDDIQVESPLNTRPDEEQYKQQQQQQIHRKKTCKRALIIIIFVIIASIVVITLIILFGKAKNGHHDYPDLKTTTSLAPVLNIRTSSTISQITTQEPIEPIYVNISGMLNLDLPFTDAFIHNTSDEYITFVGHLYDTLDAIFQNTSDTYDHATVAGFKRNGHTTNLYFSIFVNAELQEQMKDFIRTALQEEKIGEIKVLYVQFDSELPDRVT